MNSLIQQYFEIILLIYCFGCLMLSVVIYVLPKDNLQSSLLRNLPLLAVFGILHGGHEFMAWILLRYAIDNPLLQSIHLSLTLTSYLPLLEFGRRVFYDKEQLHLARIPQFYSLISCAMLMMVVFDNSISSGVMIASRLFVGLPGAAISGLAILRSANCGSYRKLKYYLQIVGGCFLVYSFSVIVLPDSESIFKQLFLNRAEFEERFMIPVQLLQMVLILTISILLTYVVRRINFHTRKAEINALKEVNNFNRHLLQRVSKRTEKLKLLINRLRCDLAERKQMEQSLKISETFNINILNSLTAHIAVLDNQGVIVAVNRAWQVFGEQNGLPGDCQNLVGVSYLDACSKAIGQLLCDDVEEIRRSIEAIIAGELQEFHAEYPCHSLKQQRWFYMTVLPLQGDRHGAVVSHENITERKKIEMEKEQFFKFFNFARDLQCIAGSDGFFKEVNPAFTDTLEFSKTELLEKPFIEFIVPEDRQKTLDEVAKQLENTIEIDAENAGVYVTLDFENRYFCKDGAVRWLSWKAIFNPADALIYATARDVSEAKKIEEKLQLADMVYQNSIEGILITDSNNQIIAVNPAFSEITGYAAEDVIGKNPKMFQSGKHDRDFYNAMWESLDSKGYWQGEIWDKRKNGEIHAKFLTINTILNKKGQLHRYLALFSDITVRKKYEQEIKRLSDSELYKAKLEAEKANQAKSEFLSGMSHELRTPMNAVLGFAQLLESEDLNEDQLDSVKEIITAGHHLMDLINGVLDLSKIEADKLEINLERIDLNALLQTCLSLIQPLAVRYEINIIDNCCDSCNFYLRGDILCLKQVLLNLMSNAIKYNQIGGTVRIFCEMSKPQTLRINVVDTGNGLSEAQLLKLFQPFERLSAKNSNIGGTGIGLIITKKLIEAMNGNIGVQSTVGEGSCFWIEIPLAD